MKVFSKFARHINWIFVVIYFVAAAIAYLLGGGWFYLLVALPIVWIIEAKGRSLNWFYVAAIPILGFIILLLLENKKKVMEARD